MNYSRDVAMLRLYKTSNFQFIFVFSNTGFSNQKSSYLTGFKNNHATKNVAAVNNWVKSRAERYPSAKEAILRSVIPNIQEETPKNHTPCFRFPTNCLRSKVFSLFIIFVCLFDLVNTEMGLKYYGGKKITDITFFPVCLNRIKKQNSPLNTGVRFDF
ncbi:hypothetical protein NIES3974_00680 [Calothrix sp. NIES-3974]|nr:hypothetical protein NIES3974_00680 [Calothrix sp. NIES-3974]